MDRKKNWKRWTTWGCLGLSIFSGCTPVSRFKSWQKDKDLSYYQSYATRIEYPNVQSASVPEVVSSPMPLTIQNPSELPTWEVSLNDAVRMALQSSDVLRSIGGSVVQAPTGAPNQLDAALTETNPLTGVDGALSAFDAQVSTQLFWQHNDRPNNFNNSFAGVFVPVTKQTTGNYISSISKTSAYGTSFAFRHNVIYDRNNSPSRLFPSDFSGFFEAEMRQPLMQGSGSTYNRIAGPTRAVGTYNGVLIARINTDISLADFEQGVITLINDVETAYWELYFAYRALEAQVDGRESALRTWQRVNELQKVSAKGGEADAEAQSRSQYYLFASQVNDALSGPTGLYTFEQRLRYVMGLPPTDGRLIKPSDTPTQAQVILDWNQALGDAITQRVEIRRQKWTIKRRELELIASKLNRRPRLDALTQYRWRGLGNHLIGDQQNIVTTQDQLDNLYQTILSGAYQEWQAGLELTFPVGLRQASAAYRFAQLNLAREVSVLKEQELRLSHDLSNAARQIDRSYLQMQTIFNRVEADLLQVEVLRNRYERGLININVLLVGQQQLATSRSAYYRALVDYSLAIRDFHRQKGSLLAYNQVNLTESALPGKATRDAYQRGRFFTPRENAPVTPSPVSEGPYDPSAVGS